MNHRSMASAAILCGAGLITAAAISLCGEPAQDQTEDHRPRQQAAIRLSVEAAKERAELMHHIYAATLDAMHHHYFHANRAVLPARAMEDVFADVARETQSTARWISVNTKAMSVHHEPASEFEKEAAVELAAGKTEFAVVEKGYYRRAGAIPLDASCVGCHTGNFVGPPKSPRFAGLVISIPVADDK
ncbi:MAG TPA: DUF3365 domain-containing protein [Planctomycetaceae bacterium]|jgi:hypothetical protein|nr:DUF3365 domain-containing protein [Planctomycetaceae bacterium]